MIRKYGVAVLILSLFPFYCSTSTLLHENALGTSAKTTISGYKCKPLDLEGTFYGIYVTLNGEVCQNATNSSDWYLDAFIRAEFAQITVFSGNFHLNDEKREQCFRKGGIVSGNVCLEYISYYELRFHGEVCVLGSCHVFDETIDIERDEDDGLSFQKIDVWEEEVGRQTNRSEYKKNGDTIPYSPFLYTKNGGIVKKKIQCFQTLYDKTNQKRKYLRM